MNTAAYRKLRTTELLRKSIDKCLDEHKDKRLYECLWPIPEYYVESKKYYMLIPVIDTYKKDGYITEFQDEDRGTTKDAKLVYFCWF